MLNIFPPSDLDGSLSHLSSRLSKEDSGKLIDMLLTCLASSQLAVALYDSTDRLQFANSSFRTAFAIDQDDYPLWADIIRCNYAQRKGLIIETNDIEAWIADISTRRRHFSSRTFECDLTDGRWIRMTETVSSNGWMLCVASDITKLKTNERVLQQARDAAMLASQTDPLTGIYNRRFIFSRLEQVLAQAKDAPLSVAVLDLDHFKEINDTYGHLAGDHILQHFATQTQKNLRPSDFLGRIGGEEFLLLLPNTTLADAEHIVERLRSKLANTTIPPGQNEISCKFSVGLTEASPLDNVASLFQRADQALYAAKQGGRNQHVVFSSSHRSE
jgi:diguanylate cyclase (GGDEF)-like protein